MADLWDSTVHVNTWKDLSEHMVENPISKKSKVIHRNFIFASQLPASEGAVDEVESLGVEPSFGTERELGEYIQAEQLPGY